MAIRECLTWGLKNCKSKFAKKQQLDCDNVQQIAKMYNCMIAKMWKWLRKCTNDSKNEQMIAKMYKWLQKYTKIAKMNEWLRIYTNDCKNMQRLQKCTNDCENIQMIAKM